MLEKGAKLTKAILWVTWPYQVNNSLNFKRKYASLVKVSTKGTKVRIKGKRFTKGNIREQNKGQTIQTKEQAN